MHRFFVSPSALQGDQAQVGGELAHQIRRVLRLRPGERVILLDDLGSACDAFLLGYAGDAVQFQIEARRPASGEPLTHLTLFQAALKGERFEWVLQKGTEVGISRFVPVVSARSIVDDLSSLAQKRARWLRIIREAAEQSGRARLPELAQALPFAAAVAEREADGPGATDGAALRLIAWEELGESGPGSGLRRTLAACNFRVGRRIQVFIGPEGGFTAAEIELARQAGLLPIGLGARILRAETAGLVTAAAILYEAGEI